MDLSRRDWLAAAFGLGLGGALPGPLVEAAEARDLRIREIRAIPIALPDPPLLAASGCHGPYFLRNVVEVVTEGGVTGIGETHGGEGVMRAVEELGGRLRGRNLLAYRAFAKEALARSRSAYAGIELAALDAAGRALGLPLSALLGGPVRSRVEFAAYLFFRYASDDPRILSDPRIVDSRGRGDRALDDWGEVRTPDAMASLAERFRKRWGFRVFKLKAGVLEPGVELEALRAIHKSLGKEHPLRIDPNGRWRLETAVRIGEAVRDLPVEYYEDPVPGQDRMAEVRRRTGLRTATNACVTRFEHIPDAVAKKPVDVVLADHHYWGGMPACQALGTLAPALGWGLSQHSNNHAGVTMAAMTHLAAVIPELTYASDTHYPWLPEGTDIIAGGKIRIEGGTIAVPSGPGVGVELDRDRLAQAHEIYRKCGMRRRDDAHTMRLVEPGWKRTRY